MNTTKSCRWARFHELNFRTVMLWRWQGITSKSQFLAHYEARRSALSTGTGNQDRASVRLKAAARRVRSVRELVAPAHKTSPVPPFPSRSPTARGWMGFRDALRCEALAIPQRLELSWLVLLRPETLLLGPRGRSGASERSGESAGPGLFPWRRRLLP